MSEIERREQPSGRRAFDEAGDATRRTRLANERTYLAWWRTGLTAIAVSLAGAGFAVLGVLCIATGYQREREIDRALTEGRFATLDPRISLILTTVGVVLGLFTLALIVVNP
jgi:putative membrane protein